MISQADDLPLVCGTNYVLTSTPGGDIDANVTDTSVFPEWKSTRQNSGN
jgi:hypothetical protein